MLSLQKSVIDQPFMRIKDVIVGSIVKGVIEKVNSAENGKQHVVVVKLSESIRGVCVGTHLSDVTLTKPEKKYKVGKSMNFRVSFFECNRCDLDPQFIFFSGACS
jgi:rRNA biogenesis protein RRP5